MKENPLVALNRLGQSVWYDNIRRSLLESGDLERMIRAGEIRGLTSNPSIFEKAIGQSNDYVNAIRALAGKGVSAEQAYESLAIEDVRAAADLLRPVFDSSRGDDGYVSLEVSPRFANDSAATAADAVRFWKAVDRSNLMIKIPGTEAGLKAVRETIAAGIPVNVTLLFSVERYRQVMDAYLSGLEDRAARNLPLQPCASVASFFISRLDTLLDPKLDAIIAAGGAYAGLAQSLRGKAAIANARLAYQAFLEVFSTPRFQKLKTMGARLQRPLWASTSTKDPAYSDVYYVDELVAADSVNTMPPATVDAYRDHGQPMLRITNGLSDAAALPASFASLGLSLDAAARQLEEDGVLAFSKAFETLLEAVAKRLGG